MGGHSFGEPNETGLGPDGMVPPWQSAPSWNQQGMPPCSLCGAAFDAHLGGMCPRPGPGTENVTAPQWPTGVHGADQQYASWAPPLGGPPFVPAMAGPRPTWDHWPRRHPWLTGVITLLLVLVSVGTFRVVSHAVAQDSGNGRACSQYWNMVKAANAYDIGSEVAGWQALQTAAPKITDPTLLTAVNAFNVDLFYSDMADAGTASDAIGSACAALGFGYPG
jgi:hypothetical protein